MAAYAVCGGIPAYLRLLRQGRTFSEGLRDHCLVGGSIMMTDASLILSDQLRDPSTYHSVLSSVAAGFHDWTGIARMSHLSDTALGAYIRTLTDLDILERRAPVLGRPAGKTSKLGRYYIVDPFLRFYYRFIVPYHRPLSSSPTPRPSCAGRCRP